MKKPRYLVFSIATVIMCVSCGITIIYILSKISKYDFPVFEGLIGIVVAICIMSLFITVNSLIEKISKLVEKNEEIESKVIHLEINRKVEEMIKSKSEEELKGE